MIEIFSPFDELKLPRFNDDRDHPRPAFEGLEHLQSQQINESHEFFYIFQSIGDVCLQKRLQLNIHHIFDCSFERDFFLDLFGDDHLVLGLGFFAEKTSHDAFLLLGFLDYDWGFFLNDFLFLPRGIIVDDLGVGFQEVMILQVFLIPVLDSFECVVLRVKVVAYLQVVLFAGEDDFPVLVFFEKQVQHYCQNARSRPFNYTIIGIVQNQNNVNLMNTNPSMAENAKILMPRSTVRTISLQKLKQPAPLAEHSQNTPNLNAKPSGPKDSKRMFEKLLDRKMSGKIENLQAKQKDKWTGKQLISNKFQQIRKEMDEKEMKECTFKPSINPSQKNTRTVNQFFNDQLNFDQKKNDKIQEMRILLENTRQKQVTFRPNTLINRQKQSHQNSNQVYDRLYQDSKNKDKKEALSRQESSETFRNNSITSSKRFRGISRGNSSQKKPICPRKESTPSLVSRQLHKESLQIDQISSELSAITTRKGSTELGNNTSRQLRKESKTKRVDVNILDKKDNSKNEQIYIGKLMKQMAVVLSRCNLPLVFSYMEMNLFLEKMNFLSNNANSRRMVYEIWNTLQGELFKEVSALSVMKIIYAIMGCHNVLTVNKCIYQSWLSNSQIVSDHEEELKKVGKQISFKQNMLMLSERDSKTLRQSYEELHLNRMKAGQSEFLKDDKEALFSFKPTISKATQGYAQRYRNRMLSETQKLLAENRISFDIPENGEIDHVDLLMLDEKRKEALLQQKREDRQKEQRRLQDESLINPNSTERESNKSSRNLQQQRDRNQELYELGKNVNQTKKDKSSDEIEEEKWKNQLTFKPNIKSKQNILNQLSSKQTQIPDYDKTVYRMQEARKSKQGSSRPSQQDDSPLLYLNVVMEGSQSVKVPVYKDDSMKSITEKVRNMMDLNQQSDNGKLEKILKMQILPALKEMNLPALMSD